MKAKHVALMGTAIMVAFVFWSMFDVTCRPCIMPLGAPEKYYCADVCIPEPRWVSWL